MKVAAWAENMAYPLASLAAWSALVDEQAAAAKAEGAEILLLPEYSAVHWLQFLPKGVTGRKSFEFVAGLSAEAAKLASGIAKKHNLLLVSGSFPVPHPGLEPPYSNRAHIHFPDGKMLLQDKLCLIPAEKAPSEWALSPGNELNVFEWKGYRIAVLICLDIELPALSAHMASLDIDLILVPSMTTKLAGYHRVFDCAKARAVELLTAVAVTGAIAGAPGNEQYISGCAFYVPCEEKFGHTGVLKSIAPSYKTEGAGPLLICDLPLDEIHQMRRSGAEAWPGAWSIDSIK
jgi:predicted amidohydrolase